MKLKNNLQKLVQTTEKVSPAPKKKYISPQSPNESNPIPSSDSRK